MDTPIPVDLGRIAQDLQIRRVQVEAVVQLLDEGNTVPFITRYRKERTNNLNEQAIREIQVRVARLRELAERKETILKSIEAQGKLTDDLAAAIRAADNPKRLEDLYLPYKPKKRTKASDARDRGLEPLALRIWNRDETLTDLRAAAAELINAEKELDTVEKVLEGVGHILAEAVSELAPVREAVRRAVWKLGKIGTSKADSVPEGQGLDFRDYFKYEEPVAHIPPHRVLAINRGDKEGALKVRLDVPRTELERAVLSQLPLEGHPHAEIFNASALDALDRLLLPSLEREVRRDLTDMAERHAVDVFARNLRSLLLQPPIAKQVVLAIDPGFRTGCKVAVLDPNGNLLDHGVIHPHPPQNRRHEAKMYLKDLVGKHKVGVVAIGNGTACRETEELVAEVITEGTHFHQNPEAGPPPGPTVTAPEGAAPLPPAEAAAPPAEPGPTTGAVEPAATEAAPPPPEAATPAAEAAPSSTEATPPAEENQPAVAEAESAADGTADTGEQVEALPPMMGGAPDDEPQPHPESQPPPAEQAQAAETPIETMPPPPEAGEATTPAAESQPVEASSQPQEPTEQPEPPPATETVLPDTVADSVAAVETHDATPATPVDATSAATAPSVPVGEEAASEGAPAPPPAADFQRPPKAPKHDQPRPPRPKQPPPPPRPHPADAQLASLSYVIVNEAGASVYSASPVGREEFPDYDATLRGTISIGRRLLDPLAELVKIEPQSIGVGLYQHDINSKQLKEALETVIESCVNFVGVDLNTASVPLLRHVSGLNALTARRIVEYRKEKGPFTGREPLKEVEGIGPVTFTQAAGFLKVREDAHPLDRTWVHPESYEVATRALEKLGFTPEVVLHKDQLPALHAKMNEADVPALARELGVGELTLHDIFEALARPDRDPREDLPKPIFKRGVLKLEDLSAGMELKGTVLNVVDFGAFVDIGLKDSGLVHISQLANRYIKSPHDVVSVGDVVTVWVMGVDQERKRVSLTMVKPGTERPRPERGPRRGQGQGESRPPSGERRGGPPRPGGPRREGPPQQPAAAGEGASSQGERPAARGPESRPAAAGSGRIPGPPARAQQGGGPGRGGFGRGGPGRGGPGNYGAPPRTDRPQPTPRPAAKPKPAPPPPPLSKDALSGSVPLRTFGQLKQLFEARARGPESESDQPAGDQPAASQPEASATAAPAEPTPQGAEAAPSHPEPASPAEAQAPAQAEPSSEPQPQGEQSGG
jgi:protein Tex